MHQVNFTFTQQRTSVQFSKYNTLCRWGSLQLYSPMVESQRDNNMICFCWGLALWEDVTKPHNAHNTMPDGIRALAMLGKALGAQLVDCAPHVQRLCPHCSTLGFKPTCWPIAVSLSLSSCFLSPLSCNVWDTIWRSWICEHMCIFKFFLELTMTMWTITIVFLFSFASITSPYEQLVNIKQVKWMQKAERVKNPPCCLKCVLCAVQRSGLL